MFFYAISLIEGTKTLVELALFFFFYIEVIDGITNKIGFTSFFAGEGIRYIGGGSISFYFLLYLFYVLIFLLISSFIFFSVIFFSY
jgi:NAD(P)H-quinone oxidoreductase subunit 5